MWETFSGGEIVHFESGAHYRAAQLPDAIPLQDLIESITPSQFHLRGRTSDMIKVAGRRTSLQEITRHLLSIPGVRDAAVFVPEPDARPVGFVVAPELPIQQVLASLGEKLEPVFVPRPLLRVEHLPRNEVGKLTREALLALWSRHRQS
jgi:acyl-coenzyme A synthetase/AMP-(fatty) acid ligase